MTTMYNGSYDLSERGKIVIKRDYKAEREMYDDCACEYIQWLVDTYDVNVNLSIEDNFYDPDAEQSIIDYYASYVVDIVGTVDKSRAMLVRLDSDHIIILVMSVV